MALQALHDLLEGRLPVADAARAAHAHRSPEELANAEGGEDLLHEVRLRCKPIKCRVPKGLETLAWRHIKCKTWKSKLCVYCR